MRTLTLTFKIANQLTCNFFFAVKKQIEKVFLFFNSRLKKCFFFPFLFKFFLIEIENVLENIYVYKLQNTN